MQGVGSWSGRLLAAMLVTGGALGVVSGLARPFLSAAGGWREAGPQLMGVVLSALPLAVGLLLWRDHPAGRRLAALLYATQVPLIEGPLLAANWYAGLSFGPLFTRAGQAWETTLALKLGMGGALDWGRAGDPVAFGINVVALAGCVFLWVGRSGPCRRAAARPLP